MNKHLAGFLLSVCVIMLLVLSGCAHNAGEATGTLNIKPSCQNYPPPSFCPGGQKDIIANGTDKKGCTIWACRQHATEHYIVTDDNATAGDKALAANLEKYLTRLFGTNITFSPRSRANITRPALMNRVTVFIYDNKALIINKEQDYGIVLRDYPFAGNPAITDYLAGTLGIFVIQRNSSEVLYDDLRVELYKGCKHAGESWRVMPATRYNVCCRGLDFSSVVREENGICIPSSDLLMCSDCGNGICEAWENRCNCQKDCH